MTDYLISNSIPETKKIAITIAKVLQKGDVLLLSGPLGSGKTTLSKYIISELTKLDAENITSPTFNIVKTYKIKFDFSVLHADLYNLKTMSQVEEIGLLNFLDNNITLIEWPKLIEDYIGYAYRVHIFVDDNNRQFYIDDQLRKKINETANK